MTPRPYWPTRTAIAPNTASGARRMTKPTIVKMISWACSIAGSTCGTLVWPRWSSAAPTRQARMRTWRSEFSAKAPMKLVGSELTMNSVVEGSAAPPVFASTAEVLRVAGSTCIPEPGRTTLARTSPMISAAVLATSNQISALRPIRPKALRSPALAMPTTTTQNTSGEMIVLMSRVNPSPRAGDPWPRRARASRRGCRGRARRRPARRVRYAVCVRRVAAGAGRTAARALLEGDGRSRTSNAGATSAMRKAASEWTL